MKKHIFLFIAFLFVFNVKAQSTAEVIQALVVGRWKAIQKDKPDFIPDVYIEFSNLIEKKAVKDARYKDFNVDCKFYDFKMSKSLINESAEGTISVGFIQEDYDPINKIKTNLLHQGVITGDKMYIVVYRPDREKVSSWTFIKEKE